MFFRKLVEWEFDELRQKKVALLSGKRGEQKLKDWQFLHHVGVGDFTEELKVAIPLFGEDVPLFILEIYGIIRDIVSPASHGFGTGVRDSKNGIEQMIERRSLHPLVLSPYISLYETSMLTAMNKGGDK